MEFRVGFEVEIQSLSLGLESALEGGSGLGLRVGLGQGSTNAGFEDKL